MTADLRLISASNGTGEAVRALVTSARSIGSMVINVDAVTNYPAYFIGTTGTLNAAGRLVAPTMQVFIGHVSGATIVIDSFAAGYTDKGNSQDDVVLIKPNTEWANTIADFLGTAHNQDGSFKVSALQAALDQLQSTDWRPVTGTPALVSTNGQREFVVNVPGDQTAVIPLGAKARIPRTGTTPTQSAKFVASSLQYGTRASVTSLGITNKVLCEGWFYFDSYSANQVMASQYNGTSGFRLDLDSAGKIRMIANNGGDSLYRLVTSYQTVPLKRWMHIAAVVDVSAFNLTNCRILIDGTPIPAQLVDVSAFTSFTPAGALQVGASNSSSTSVMDGYASNVRIWNVNRTDTQIRDNMNQQIPGTSTGLVASYLLNGSWNDTSGNNNHLTAVGGAVNNFASHPFNPIEFGVVTGKGAFAGGFTPVTIFTGQSNTIPNETLGQFSYSTARSPYGFPSNRALWRVYTLIRTELAVATGGATNWLVPAAGTFGFRVPSGTWNVGYSVEFGVDRGGAGRTDVAFTLTTTANTETHPELTVANRGGSGNTFQTSTSNREQSIENTTATTFYPAGRPLLGGTSIFYINSAGFNTSILYADCPYI